MRKCSIEGCERKHYAKGWCKRHYNSARDAAAKAPCAVEGCSKPARTAGRCSGHYERQRSGHPDPDGQLKHDHATYTPYAARLEFLAASNCAVSHGDLRCRPWPSTWPMSIHGYGRVVLGGKEVNAHRAALVMATGQDPVGLHALHAPLLCHDRSCVSVAHLRWGTPRENLLDMLVDGTHLRGADVGGSKLNEADVLAIRQARSSGVTQQALADRYGVTRSTIGSIERRSTWKHV